MKNLHAILHKYSDKHLEMMLEQLSLIYEKYFSSIKAITLGIIDLLESRTNPTFSKTYESWNFINETKSPLVIPFMPDKSKGFTAVIVGLKSISNIKHLINTILVKCANLAHVLILWYGSNDRITITALESINSKNEHFEVNIKLMYISDYLSRFYPFEEIKTESVLFLDESMYLINKKDIESAYEVWRSFPDRLVRFESKLLKANFLNEDKDLENYLSQSFMPYFYNSYYNHHYIEFKNKHQAIFSSLNYYNCENIIMDFIVKNLTGKDTILVKTSYSESLRSFNFKKSVELSVFTNCIKIISKLNLNSIYNHTLPYYFVDTFSIN
jgi:hypothetical protein